jgi:hypothetical protein
MVNVPEQFRPHIRVAYPEHNDLIFEEWFYRNFKDDGVINGYAMTYYLPVFWTSYHVNHKYGTIIAARQALQKFIDSLDRAKQYFTICQYDSGPLVKFPQNIKMFAMSGPIIDYPIPLVCHPHNFDFRNERRDIFANFIGRMTHNIRHKMMRVLRNDRKYHTSQHIVSTEDYCRVMAKSVFTLCPRGFGQSSFRICEALEQGSIPVYVSDEFIFPGHVDFETYGVVIRENQIEQIDQILSALTPEQIKAKQECGKRIYQEMYTFTGVRNLILNNL